MWEKRNILYKILVRKPDIDTRMWTGYMRRYTSGVLLWTRQWTFKFSKRPSQWPLACWNCGFEPRQGNGRRSLRTVVCCQAEFWAGHSSEGVLPSVWCTTVKPRQWGGPGTLGGKGEAFAPCVKKYHEQLIHKGLPKHCATRLVKDSCS